MAPDVCVPGDEKCGRGFLSPVTLVITLTAYLALLFWIARIGDRRRFSTSGWVRHPLVYTFAIGVPILLGPLLLFTLGFPLLQRIADVCRQENIHSIADFIASRYGKRQSVAAIVTLIMLTATVPYIALQLKAVSRRFQLPFRNNGCDCIRVTNQGHRPDSHCNICPQPLQRL